MKIYLCCVVILTISTVLAQNETTPAEKKKISMPQLAPPLELDPSCRVVSCYRNMLNMSNECEKGEFLHSFKKCEKKFFREDTCCKKKTAN
ncbi:unnamed protein product [Caenorhabditis sp. 36 PRJEB53466]|nr:unnamed protein product [Caenorhabditis sp. 36 PRJEB53466]